MDCLSFGRAFGTHIKTAGPANIADAHGSSYVPYIGGAISGAVKPHPSRNALRSSMGEGLAGLAGGARGTLLGAGTSAALNLLTRGKLGLKSNALAGILGGSVGTHMGSQWHREDLPLNARALEEMGRSAVSKKASGEFNPNSMSRVPVKQAFEGNELAPYTAWGRGYNFGTSTSNNHNQNALLSGGLLGGVAGLAAEAMREKNEEEKKQSLLRKVLRYAASGGAGAVGGAGVGGALGAMTAPGMLRMHESVAAKLPPELLSGKFEAQILDSMNKKSGAQAAEKSAFMGLGGIAGMATAPSKEEEDLSIGRGALRGAGTALGVVPGAVTGGLAGGLGAAGLGALLGAVLRTDPKLSQRMGAGAGTFAPLGMLAGGLGGAVYGGYKGNKATKALLDKTAPISEKKKKKEDGTVKVSGLGDMLGAFTKKLPMKPIATAGKPVASAAPARLGGYRPAGSRAGEIVTFPRPPRPAGQVVDLPEVADGSLKLAKDEKLANFGQFVGAGMNAAPKPGFVG